MTRSAPFLASCLLFLVGCATLQSGDADSRTQLYSAPYDGVYDAVLETVVSRGYWITSADRSSGMVTAHEKSLLGAVSEALLLRSRIKVTLLIRPIQAGTSVTLYISVGMLPMATKLSDPIYRDLFEKISQTLKIHDR